MICSPQIAHLTRRPVMTVQWTSDLSTKVSAIDDQHRELFEQLDLLLNAWRGGKGREDVEKILRFLDDYVAYHFRTEERFMEQHRYSSTSAHKAQHGVFVRSFQRLKDRYFRTGADAGLIEETNELLVDWFVKHIKYSDKALGLFLKMKLQSPVGTAHSL
jgi:hemerythrin